MQSTNNVGLLSPCPCRETEPAANPAWAQANAWDSHWEALSDEQQLLREQSQEYVQNLTAVLAPNRDLRVLDFGCGSGFVAQQLAPRVGQLYLWDHSANMRRRAQERVANLANVQFIELCGKGSKHLPRFDWILVNSVVQYMTPDEFSGWLRCWRQRLTPGGRIIVSDIILPDHSTLGDILAVLHLSARRGFLLRAVWQAAGEFLGYWKKRWQRPLTRFSRDDLRRLAALADLGVAFLPRNLTHFPRRTTAIFSLPSPPASGGSDRAFR
jgi:SAM-dependent methyltransferase